jgi:hypothetical protein
MYVDFITETSKAIRFCIESKKEFNYICLFYCIIVSNIMIEGFTLKALYLLYVCTIQKTHLCTCSKDIPVGEYKIMESSMHFYS